MKTVLLPKFITNLSKIHPTFILTVTAILTIWVSYISATGRWSLFQDYWPCSITMVLGSLIAGLTPGGGGAFAFPVFTKVLQISAADARTFAYMIQSVGMVVAALFIITSSIKYLPRVVLYASLGGAVGTLFGTYCISIPNPLPKVIFTISIATFGVALFISRYVVTSPPTKDLPTWKTKEILGFVFAGFVGGLLSSQTGSGIDMLVFVILTLAYGIDEKISTPTSVIIMAANSVVGFVVHGVGVRDIGICWDYWLVCVPIVIIGAPLGALLASKVNRNFIIHLLIALTLLELATTLWLIPLTTQLVVYMILACMGCSVWFAGMLNYRQKRIVILSTYK